MQSLLSFDDNVVTESLNSLLSTDFDLDKHAHASLLDDVCVPSAASISSDGELSDAALMIDEPVAKRRCIASDTDMMMTSMSMSGDAFWSSFNALQSLAPTSRSVSPVSDAEASAAAAAMLSPVLLTDDHSVPMPMPMPVPGTPTDSEHDVMSILSPCSDDMLLAEVVEQASTPVVSPMGVTGSLTERDVEINLHTQDGGTKLIHDIVVYRSGRDRCPLRPQLLVSAAAAGMVRSVTCNLVSDADLHVLDDVVVDATGLPRNVREDADRALPRVSQAQGVLQKSSAYAFNLLLLTTCRKSRCLLFRLRFNIEYQCPDTMQVHVLRVLSRPFKAVSGNVGPKNLALLREQLGELARQSISSVTPMPMMVMPVVGRGIKRRR